MAKIVKRVEKGQNRQNRDIRGFVYMWRDGQNHDFLTPPGSKSRVSGQDGNLGEGCCKRCVFKPPYPKKWKNWKKHENPARAEKGTFRPPPGVENGLFRRKTCFKIAYRTISAQISTLPGRNRGPNLKIISKCFPVPLRTKVFFCTRPVLTSETGFWGSKR